MVNKNGTNCPLPPIEPRVPVTPISPVVSVRSVNGEYGDVVLKKLFFGDKEYNGSDEKHLYAEDLGLGKAFVYAQAISSIELVQKALLTAKCGDVFFCSEDKKFYLSVGEGDSKSWGGDGYYAKVAETASKIGLEIDGETFELTAKLFDKDGNLFFTSAPVVIPHEIQDIIKNAYYDGDTKELVFVLKNDQEIRVPIQGLVEDLQPKITESNKLPFQLVQGLPEFRVEIIGKVDQEIQDRADAVAIERNARMQADADEKTARENADTQLQSQITEQGSGLATEIQDRKLEDRALNLRIDALRTDLTTEVNTRTTETASLREDLTSESATRVEEFNTLSTNIEQERQKRIYQDGLLSDRIVAEQDARVAKDSELNSLITTESAQRQSADGVLTTAINTEVAARQDAINSEKAQREEADRILSDTISAERTRALEAENTLQSNINLEASTREQKDLALHNEVVAEANERARQDNLIVADLNTEITNRTNADASLQSQIDNIPVYGMIKDSNPGEFSAVYHLTKQINGGEVVNVGEPINIAKDYLVKSATLKTVTEEGKPYPGAKVGDKYIDFVINTKDQSEEDQHLYLPVNDLVDVYTGGYGITVSADRSIALSSDFQYRVGKIETDLSNETTNRVSNDNYIIGLLNTETQERKSVDEANKTELQTNIDNEAATRLQVDISLKNDYVAKISAEQTARENADTTLNTNLTNKINNDISTVNTRITNLDSTLSTRISTEISERKEKDQEFSESIDTLTSGLATESTTRETADTDLQRQINEINAKVTTYTGTITGDGVRTEFTLEHNLGSKDLMIQLVDLSTYETVIVDSKRMTDDTIKITFKEAPATTDQYRVLCVKMGNGFKITFNANGGSGEMASQTAYANTPFLIPACTFERPQGATFDGWAIGSPTGTKVGVGVLYTFSGPTTLYATWINTGYTFYHGAVVSDTQPSTTDDLTGSIKTASELLATDGISITYSASQTDAWITVAVDKSLGVKIKDVKVLDYSYLSLIENKETTNEYLYTTSEQIALDTAMTWVWTFQAIE